MYKKSLNFFFIMFIKFSDFYYQLFLFIKYMKSDPQELKPGIIKSLPDGKCLKHK